MLCMETIAKIRRLYYQDKLSQREIAKSLRLNRRTIRRHLQTVEPPQYKRSKQHYPKLGEYLTFIDEHLLTQSCKPKRERLSVRRLFELLRSKGYQGQYPALCSYVRGFNARQALKPKEVFIPQRFAPAEAYQFDWSTEQVCLAGELTKVRVAHFRLCHSLAFFIKAYPNEQMEMLVDAHNTAFEFFGGVCKKGIYDNMKTAVTALGNGKDRLWNEQFLGLMNHYLIEPVACTPASGWEKGQVERQVQTLRKRLFKPTLSFASIEELNAYLAQQCLALMRTFRHPEDKSIEVLERFKQEQASLFKCNAYHWYKTKHMQVNSLSLVAYQGHKYSVPCDLVGKQVLLQIFAQEIKVIYEGRCVAQHARSFIKNQSSYNPWHYLKALQKKPGALRNGEPFLNWVLPEPIKTLEKHILQKSRGDRAMVQLLSLIAEYGEEVGVTAACIALEEKIPTVEAVHNIINRLLEPTPPRLQVKEIPLQLPPQGNCERYNSLLTERRSHATI